MRCSWQGRQQQDGSVAQMGPTGPGLKRQSTEVGIVGDRLLARIPMSLRRPISSRSHFRALAFVVKVRMAHRLDSLGGQTVIWSAVCASGAFQALHCMKGLTPGARLVKIHVVHPGNGVRQGHHY